MDMASRTFIAQVPALVAEGKLTRAQLDEAVLPVKGGVKGDQYGGAKGSQLLV